MKPLLAPAGATDIDDVVRDGRLEHVPAKSITMISDRKRKTGWAACVALIISLGYARVTQLNLRELKVNFELTYI